MSINDNDIMAISIFALTFALTFALIIVIGYLIYDGTVNPRLVCHEEPVLDDRSATIIMDTGEKVTICLEE